jgi:hypothetical protein
MAKKAVKLADLAKLNDEGTLPTTSLAGGYASLQAAPLADGNQDGNQKLSDIDDSDEQAKAVDETVAGVKEKPEPPFLCYYDSTSHKKRRYYVEYPPNASKPKFTYDKAEATLMANEDYGIQVMRVCFREGYALSMRKPEDC